MRQRAQYDRFGKAGMGNQQGGPRRPVIGVEVLAVREMDPRTPLKSFAFGGGGAGGGSPFDGGAVPASRTST